MSNEYYYPITNYFAYGSIETLLIYQRHAADHREAVEGVLVLIQLGVSYGHYNDNITFLPGCYVHTKVVSTDQKNPVT